MSSTGSRISFSTQLETIPWTCPRLYVCPFDTASGEKLASRLQSLPYHLEQAMLTYLGGSGIAISRKVVGTGEHCRQRLSAPR
jgi:hypothetical protein